jgi:exopolysaccharide biosynthesis polyprenyl glycosylphosphotransferase
MDNPLDRHRWWRWPAPAVVTGRVLIVGFHRDSRRVARSLRDGPWLGLPVIGFVDAGHPRHSGGPSRGRQLALHSQSEPVPVLGRLDSLAEVVTRSGATHLVVAMSGPQGKRLEPALNSLNCAEVSVHWVGEARKAGTVGHAPHLSSPPNVGWRWDRLAKRVVDATAAFLGLLLLSPLLLIVALIIWATSGRPILYTQERVGQGGRVFKLFKFRSMSVDAEGSTGPIWASNYDQRCTKVGSWLRRSNIDELPQLMNVVMGDMSLVGPRPERPIFVDQFRTAVPDYDLRHAMPGGMTGWAQVHGWRGRTSLRKRVQYDLDYIQRWNFWLDLKVLVMTIEHVCWSRTSWGKPEPLRGLSARTRRGRR